MSIELACFWLFAPVRVHYFREELIFRFKLWYSAKSLMKVAVVNFKCR
jgi:hypothetical protein